MPIKWNTEEEVETLETKAAYTMEAARVNAANGLPPMSFPCKDGEQAEKIAEIINGSNEFRAFVTVGWFSQIKVVPV